MTKPDRNITTSLKSCGPQSTWKCSLSYSTNVSGQIIIFHQPRFFWNFRGPISLPNRYQNWGFQTRVLGHDEIWPDVSNVWLMIVPVFGELCDEKKGPPWTEKVRLVSWSPDSSSLSHLMSSALFTWTWSTRDFRTFLNQISPPGL